MRKDIRSSTSPKALAASFPVPTLGDAMEEVRLSVDRFCLLAGIGALQEIWRKMPRRVRCPAPPPWGPSGISLGQDGERDRLPRRQGYDG